MALATDCRKGGICSTGMKVPDRNIIGKVMTLDTAAAAWPSLTNLVRSMLRPTKPKVSKITTIGSMILTKRTALKARYPTPNISSADSIAMMNW
jgi:hypothetical protein